MPFDIPNSWVWIRLSSFCNIYTGDSISENDKNRIYKYVKRGWDYIGTKDVNFDHSIVYENGVKIPYISSFKICPPSKVLLCIEGGSAGRKIALTAKKVCFGNKLACFNSWGVADEYLYLFLQSPLFLQLFKDKLTGIISGVSVNNLKKLMVPLPPKREQSRIIKTYKTIEPLIKKYEVIENELTSLERDFENKLKDSILQYAVEGKLVQQDPNDEPASILLEKIKVEKERLIDEGRIKREKGKSALVQTDDNNYYGNIPNGWICSKLSFVINLISGNDLQPSEYSPRNIGVPYITGASNFYNGKIISRRYTNSKYVNSYKGDILLTCKGTIGELAFNDIGDCHVARDHGRIMCIAKTRRLPPCHII